MDPNTLPKPQFELPQPPVTVGQEATGPNAGEQETGQPDERRNMEMPATASPVAPPQATAPFDPSVVPIAGVAPTPPGPISDKTIVAAEDMLLAEDNDLIEKAWVIKAKSIVNQTRDDPHKQNTEINKVKKDYIQKRYHKDIKLNDE